MDNLTRDQRRKNMQNIRSMDTKPERIIFSELRQRKIYFARHVHSISGKPDIVFRRKRLLVFIDSDFWHGHPTRGVMPKSNPEYWQKKIRGNKERDKRITSKLRKEGWKVIRLWEHDVRKRTTTCVRSITRALTLPDA